MEELVWELLPWGYQVLLSVEGMRNTFLDVVFPVVTDFGSELGYIVILSLVYWCVNKTVGQGLAFAYLYTSVLNSWIKLSYGIPRPDHPAVESLLEESNVTERLNPEQKKRSSQVAAVESMMLQTKARCRQSRNLRLRLLQSMPACDRFACVSKSHSH